MWQPVCWQESVDSSCWDILGPVIYPLENPTTWIPSPPWSWEALPSWEAAVLCGNDRRCRNYDYHQQSDDGTEHGGVWKTDGSGIDYHRAVGDRIWKKGQRVGGGRTMKKSNILSNCQGESRVARKSHVSGRTGDGHPKRGFG